MPEQEKFQPTPEQTIEGKFGKETLERASNVSKSVWVTMREALINIADQAGTSQQQQEEAEKYLTMWQDFANILAVRTRGQNTTSPELVETALKGAHALLAIKPLQEFEEPAKKMIEALQTHY